MYDYMKALISSAVPMGSAALQTGQLGLQLEKS